MNKPRIERLINLLENDDLYDLFDMGNYGIELDPIGLRRVSEVFQGERDPSACGTAGCIAGWAIALFRGGEYSMNRGMSEQAGELLGLDRATAQELFLPDQELEKITPRQAAQALKVLISGDNDTDLWDHLMEENYA